MISYENLPYQYDRELKKCASGTLHCKKQQESLDTLFEEGEGLHIIIMNVEALSTDKGTAFAKKFMSCHNTLMAIDESTTIKNPKAGRTRNILDLARETKYRRIMTGSPVTKNPLDLFSQCYFLDPFHLEHESYYSFRTRYAIMKTAHISGRSIQLVSGFKNLGELSDKLKPFSYRVLKEDCLDLPDKIYIKRQITLSPDQRKLYEQMKKEALAILNGKQVTTEILLPSQFFRFKKLRTKNKDVIIKINMVSKPLICVRNKLTMIAAESPITNLGTKNSIPV